MAAPLPCYFGHLAQSDPSKTHTTEEGTLVACIHVHGMRMKSLPLGVPLHARCTPLITHTSFQHAFVMAASLSSARRVPRSLLPENTVLHSAPVHVHICRHAEVAPFCCVGACPALPSCVVHDAPAKPHRPLLLHAL